MSVGYYMNFIWWGPWNALTIIHESYGVRFVELPPSLFRKKSKSCCLIVEELSNEGGEKMPCNACLLPARNLMSRCKDVLVKVYS